MIYVISMQDGKFIKVGFTSGQTSQQRIASLQTSSPYQLDEVFSVEGTLRQEQALHGSLKIAFHRIRIPIPGNEWYPGRHPFIQKFIEALRERGPNGAMAVSEAMNPSVRQLGTSPKFDEKNCRRINQERSYA